MKRICLLSLLFIPLISFAQITLSPKDDLGRTLAKNKYGKIIAIGEKDFLGNFVWKDPAGNIIKKETVDFLGRTLSRDDKGKVISTKERNFMGDVEEKDPQGNLIAKYRTNFMGEVEKLDAYGRIIGKYRSSFSGDIVYSENTNYRSETSENKKGSYSNPKVITPVYSKPYQFSEEYYEAMGAILAKTLTGFGLYAGYNEGFNLGIDVWLGKKASYGIHYGTTDIQDSDGYGINTREEFALNLGFYITKKKNLILKTSWGYTNLDLNYDEYPDLGQQTFEQWEEGYNRWADKAYTKFYYKVGIQFALSKKNKGSGFSPEIYYSTNGIGFGLGYIINVKNSNY
ncbi:hypothetical protein OAJ14_00515 [Polaribacter sp.]|nr:hypothetical protein [Polaribacter sp.]|tara:strand:+ start:128 stop:1153 length:1026 start_codon:yes stop_codon:yes gene_type:complete